MKKIAITAVVLAMASLSQASELWWTVANPATGTSENWATAQLFATDNGYNFNGEPVGTAVSASDMAEFGNWNTDLGEYAASAYSFYVELYNSANDSLGRSAINVDPSAKQGAVSYTDLVSAGAIYDGNLMNPTTSAYSGFSSFTTSNVVPEPTSGLLVLFGMMALGLKRKRA